MQNEREVLASHDDEIDLRELFSVLWAGKKVIVAITGLFAVAAVVYALSIANEYKASIVIAPAQQEVRRRRQRRRTAAARRGAA